MIHGVAIGDRSNPKILYEKAFDTEVAAARYAEYMATHNTLFGIHLRTEVVRTESVVVLEFKSPLGYVLGGKKCEFPGMSEMEENDSPPVCKQNQCNNGDTS